MYLSAQFKCMYAFFVCHITVNGQTNKHRKITIVNGRLHLFTHIYLNIFRSLK